MIAYIATAFFAGAALAFIASVLIADAERRQTSKDYMEMARGAIEMYKEIEDLRRQLRSFEGEEWKNVNNHEA